MANPTSPVTLVNAAQQDIAVRAMQRVFLRIESGGTFLVHFKMNGTADATHADGFLTSGEDVEIPFVTAGVLNLYAVTGGPKLFYGFLDNSYPTG